MDDVRDIKKPDSFSKLLDSREVRTNPFGRNISVEKSYRRAERLVAAMHLITSHVPATEPVRASIRSTSINLLEDVLSLRDEMRNAHSVKVQKAQSTIRRLISLIRLLGVSGLVSIQNIDMLVEATDELGNFLNLSQRTPLSESIVFTRDELLSAAPAVAGRRSAFMKDKVLPRDIMTHTSVIRTVGAMTDSEKDTDMSASRTTDTSPRRTAVIDFLHSVSDAGIRDIAASLPEYSEKMIQRELASLVALGKVKKIGLKRWSRYSIISQ